MPDHRCENIKKILLPKKSCYFVSPVAVWSYIISPAIYHSQKILVSVSQKSRASHVHLAHTAHTHTARRLTLDELLGLEVALQVVYLPEPHEEQHAHHAHLNPQ